MLDQKNVNYHDCDSCTFEESEIEIIRLIQQSELFTEFEGGILPENESLSGITKILDVACGPGQWAIETAEQYPDIFVVGIDISKRMTNYARANSTNLENVQFLEMDITTRLNFSNQSFDVVNARFLQGVLTTEEWPSFLSECMRILRPGGMIRLTEMSFTESNSREFNQLLSLVPLALYHTGRSFSPDGLNYGMTPALSTLLHTAGCRSPYFRPFAIDFSCGTEAHESMMQYLRITYAPHLLLGTFLVKTGVISELNYEELYNRAMNDLGSSCFSGMSYLTTAIGEKQQPSVIVISHDRFIA